MSMLHSHDAGIRPDELPAKSVADRSPSRQVASESNQDLLPIQHDARSSQPGVAASQPGVTSSHPDVFRPKIYTFPRLVRYARILTRLDGFEWRLLLRMSRQLGTLLITQRKVSMPELMARFDSEPISHDLPRLTPSRLVFLVTGLVRVTLRDRYCMKRSILIFHYLRRWGYSVRILFGVVKSDEALEGHAWVELNGRPLAERGDPRTRYAVTYAYPGD